MDPPVEARDLDVKEHVGEKQKHTYASSHSHVKTMLVFNANTRLGSEKKPHGKASGPAFAGSMCPQ
jgi:hypothetical protein